MTKAIDTQDRIILHMDDNESLQHTVTEGDFEFTFGVPSLFEESSLSLDTLHILQRLLKNPKYTKLIETVKIPSLNVVQQEKTDKESTDTENKKDDKLAMSYQDVDIDKLNHLSYLVQFLPMQIATLASSIAFLNIRISNIRYKNQPITVKSKEKTINIETFEDFVMNVKIKNLNIQDLIDSLNSKLLAWISDIEITPNEVKN